jgi:hypothetical protein
MSFENAQAMVRRYRQLTPAFTQEDMDRALTFLLLLIQDGVEYPDAEWKAASKFQVGSDALRRAYDNYCANKP